MDSEIYEYDDHEDEKPKRDLPGADEPPRQRSSRWPLYVVLGCLLSCFACCVLPVCALTMVVGGVVALLENSEVTETRTRTVTLETEDPITLQVDNRVGDIIIERGSSSGEVEVEYTRRAHGLTKGQARTELNNIEVLITQPEVDQVSVVVNMDNTKDTVFALSNEVDMTIRVPESLAIEVETNVGSIQVQDVQARALTIKNNTGDIEFDGELGTNPNEPFSLETNVGTITVTLPDDTFLAIDAETDVGDVQISENFVRESTDGSEGQGDAVSDRWIGTIGEGKEDPPTLTLKVNVGDITIQTR